MAQAPMNYLLTNLGIYIDLPPKGLTRKFGIFRQIFREPV